MKKQVKVLLIGIISLAVVVAVISLFYPDVYKGLSSGTFGKADKYHKVTLSEKDILLRNEITADTSKLLDMISGLVYFSAFGQDLANTLDTGIMVFKANGIEVNKDDAMQIKAMQDYSDFIKNNNKTLNSTIGMLTSFYTNEYPDQSLDVEKTLIDFGNYVTNLNQKDSIFNKTFERMDQFLLNNKTLTQKPGEFANLKSIRDKMLIKGIQLSGLLQDAALFGSLCSYALSSQNSFNIIILSMDKLNIDEAASAIASQGQFSSSENLHAFMSAETLNLGAIGAQQAVQLSGGIIVGSGEIVVGSNSDLGVIIDSHLSGSAQQTNSQQQVKSGATGSLMMYNSSSLQYFVVSSSQLQGALSSNQLNRLLSIGSVGIGAVPIAFVDVVEGFVVGSQYDLSGYVSSSAFSSSVNATNLVILTGVINSSPISCQYGSTFMGAQGLTGSLNLLNVPNQ